MRCTLMNKRLMIISVFFLFVVGSLTIWLTQRWIVRGQSKQDADASAQLSQPYAQVDEKAGAVQGADEGAIRELADAVLLLAMGNEVPRVLVSPYKERLVRTEVIYRRGQKAGIPEVNIVRV